MLHKAGTVAELEGLELRGRIPEEVYLEMLRIVTMLDERFGEERDIDCDDGGYVFVAENQNDLEYFDANCVEPEIQIHSLEYVLLIETEKEPYLNAFILYNEYEFGVTLLLPMSIAPGFFLKELAFGERTGLVSEAGR
jgi:hypothetical protein